MAAVLIVPEAWLERLRDLITRERLPISAASDGQGDVIVIDGDPPKSECGERELRVGGRLACQTGKAVASRLGVSPRKLRPLLDLFQIKVRACEWGCF
ncbi:MAG TPA: hypothetical protein PL033_20440 [Candidatus Brocadiia bacterium]|nr:hypothetical protein [Candidatus Brocadiia bacterium]